ncbi:hypothetical protein LTR85_007729 [Meristemomyces frigidus]|nr:hypothetical protein LTR85_007729 [Meristemomyces frigidus]
MNPAMTAGEGIARVDVLKWWFDVNLTTDPATALASMYAVMTSMDGARWDRAIIAVANRYAYQNFRLMQDEINLQILRWYHSMGPGPHSLDDLRPVDPATLNRLELYEVAVENEFTLAGMSMEGLCQRLAELAAGHHARLLIRQELRNALAAPLVQLQQSYGHQTQMQHAQTQQQGQANQAPGNGQASTNQRNTSAADHDGDEGARDVIKVEE